MNVRAIIFLSVNCGVVSMPFFPVYPTAAYEHGPLPYRGVEMRSPLKRPSIAGSIVPFPASPNETGPLL